MILIEDNFLSTDDFDWLNAVAEQKADLSLQIAQDQNKRNVANIKFYKKDETAWDYGFIVRNTGTTIAYSAIGENIQHIINQVEKRIEQAVPSLDPLQTIFFMFSKEGYEVNKHKDIRSLNTPDEKLQKIYKAFIFCHRQWEDNWGGELCFSTETVLPKPNRLVVYSSDELHWVNKVNKIDNNRRMIFTVRYGNEI